MASSILLPSSTLDNVPGASGPAQNGHLVFAVNANRWWFFTWAGKVDSGTFSASSTASQPVDTSKSWTSGVHLGRTCIITGGTGAGESFLIGTNTATGLPVVDDAGLSSLGTAPNATSTYVIMDSDLVRAYVSSGPDLSTATWAEATGSPTPQIKTSSNNIGYGIGIHGGSINVGGAGQYPTDGRLLQVGYANVSGVDVFLLFVQMDSHYFQVSMRGRLTAADTIAWDGVISGTTNNWNDTAPGMDCVPQFPDGNAVGYSSTGRWWNMQDQNGRIAVGYAANSADPGTANFNENWQGNNGASAPTSFDTGAGDTVQSALIPLASGFMLAVYCAGNTASPAGAGNATQTGLRFAESASATQWPTTSTGAAVPNLSATTNDPNDWGIVKIDNTHIMVVRRNGATALEHVIYSGHGGSWGAKVNLPTSGLTGHLAGSGVTLVSDGTNVWCFVIDTDANKSVKYVKWNGSAWSASWSTLSGPGTETKNFIAAYMRSDGGQIGVVWTGNASTPYAVNYAWLSLTTPTMPGVVERALPPPVVTIPYGTRNYRQQVTAYLRRMQMAMPAIAPATQAFRDALGRANLVAPGWRDAIGRFRLQVLGYRDAPGRFRLMAPAWRDALGRFRLQAPAWRDAIGRFRLQVLAYRDAPGRFRLMGLSYRDGIGRFRMLANGARDALGRFRLQVLAYRDAPGRFRLQATGYRDAAGRFRLQVLAYRDAIGRFRLMAPGWRDAPGRFRLMATGWRDAAGRFRLTVPGLAYRDALGRFRLQVGAWRDAAGRFSMAVLAYRDARGRARLMAPGWRDALGRFRLLANGWRDARGRFSLAVFAFRDARGRASLRAQSWRDAAGRASLQAQSWRSALGRFAVLAPFWRDARGRLSLRAPGWRDGMGRFSLFAPPTGPLMVGPTRVVGTGAATRSTGTGSTRVV